MPIFRTPEVEWVTKNDIADPLKRPRRMLLLAYDPQYRILDTKFALQNGLDAMAEPDRSVQA